MNSEGGSENPLETQFGGSVGSSHGGKNGPLADSLPG